MTNRTVDNVGKLARLRDLLWQMEAELGLERLTQHQRDLYYAACLMANKDRTLNSSDLKNHPILESMAWPTFYRALKFLVDQGFLESSGTKKSGSYRLKR